MDCAVITLKAEACKDTPELLSMWEKEEKPPGCEENRIMLHWELIYACHEREWWLDSLRDTLSLPQLMTQSIEVCLTSNTSLRTWIKCFILLLQKVCLLRMHFFRRMNVWEYIECETGWWELYAGINISGHLPRFIIESMFRISCKKPL